MSKSKKTRKPPKRRPRRRPLAASENGTAKPADSQAAIQSALALQQAGNLKQAALIYQQVLETEPENPDAWHLLGMTLFTGDEFETAIECLQNALVLVPDHPDVLANLGVVYRSSGDHANAQLVLEKAVQINPDSVQAQTNLGTVYLEQGSYDAAQSQFEKALSIDAQFDQAAMNLANLWQRQGRFHDAESCYRSILEQGNPDPVALNNLAETLRHQRKWDEAIKFSRRAIELAPDSIDFQITLGRSLAGGMEVEEAKAQFLQLIERYPSLGTAYHYLGRLQFEQRDLENAVVNLMRAVELDPSDLYALSSLGFAYMEMGKSEIAEACFRTVVQIDPTNSQAHGCLLFFMSNKADACQRELFEEHRKWGALHGAVEAICSDWKSSGREQNKTKRLRIGYVSPDFCNHAVNKFFLPVLQSHRPEQVETFCYAEVAVPDETTEQLIELTDHWRFTHGLSDEQIAHQVQNDEIDILVDLAGHTANNRLRVFAYRPAPVQVTWLGYPNTTGLAAIDYRLTCDIQNPPDEPTYHTEQLYLMPNGSFCFSRPVNSPEVSDLPAIRNGCVTFGSLHRPDKISDSARDLWAAVLKACPASRLIAFNTRFTPESANELLHSLSGLGVEAERVTILNQLDADSYLDLYDQIDISLDVTPWAGGTTTLESMWMGAPVIAFHGDRRSARSTAAIVNNVGHPELIAKSQESYVAIAKRLSGDLDSLASIRQGLRNKIEATIVDANRFVDDLEQAYRDMWQRWCDDC